jgi:hypothetical protein
MPPDACALGGFFLRQRTDFGLFLARKKVQKTAEKG